MSHPKDEDLAAVLGVKVEAVRQLERRGMPTGNLRRARRWFQANGFTSLANGKPRMR